MIRIEDNDVVRVLHLARPPVNALGREMLAAIRDQVATTSEPGIRAAVLAGSDGIFSAGLDLPELLSLGPDDLKDALELFFDAMEALATAPVPIVAAITGHCPAGGAVLSLFCDLRIMADGPYSIGLNEVRVGIPMPEVVAALARRALGPRQAEIALVAGQMVSPADAVVMGFVDEVVPPADVVPRALDRARELAALPQRARDVTRSRMRSDLVDIVARYRAADCAFLAEEWFRPEVQEPLRALVNRLKSGA